jgi:hypothetical protein
VASIALPTKAKVVFDKAQLLSGSRAPDLENLVSLPAKGKGGQKVVCVLSHGIRRRFAKAREDSVLTVALS